MEKITVREALCQAIAEEMRIDSSVFVIGEEVAEYDGAYKVTKGLLQEFGNQRVVDTPITEHGFAGLAVGAALAGLRPIVEFMTFNFAMQAIDHIINSAAKIYYMSGGKINCPIVFRGPNGIASRVAAQHSQCYASWYGHIPGLKVISPYDASDAKGLLKSAIRDPNPVIFLEHELLYGDSYECVVKNEEELKKYRLIHQKDDGIISTFSDIVLPIGKSLLRKTGKDVTIVGFSRSVKLSLKAAEILEDIHKISADVIDLRTIRPIDIFTIITSVKKTNRLVVVEEGWPFSGISSEIISQVIELAFDDLDAPPQRVCGKDVPMPYADNLEKIATPSIENIIDTVKSICFKTIF
ncbi:Pyruvate dehydrogenase E1 subunit beta [Lyticum sinuosum]|uniref:Pyruvate dehydrogenase E1 component subunit beta n=1 Tax=Lyticum sinuosum TaxID=1332059 RepID=A0AAE4VM33_9RICK|nr:Pyruvate dehydrogenase E1 subunit beta [Lyticum sinuosum]